MWKFAVIVLLLTAVAVPSVLVATQGRQATEARINAYKHEDGRVEFAMQVREGSDWSERILPSGRYLRETSPTGRWLNSTSVTIPVGDAPLPALPILVNNGIHQAYYERPTNGEIHFTAWNYTDIQPVNTTTITIVADQMENNRLHHIAFQVSCNEHFEHPNGEYIPAVFRAGFNVWVHGEYGYPVVLPHDVYAISLVAYDDEAHESIKTW